MGNTKSKWKNGQLAFYDGTTQETTQPLAPTMLYDDFLGTVYNSDVWTSLDLNSATLTVPAASVGAASIGAVNENAAAGLYGQDDKAWNIDKGFIFECRMTVAAAPTLTTEIGFGMMNDSYGADSMRFMLADEMAKYAFFGFYTTSGAGLVPIIRTDDGTAASGIVSTGVTAVVGTHNIYRIDFTDSSDVKFYIDGVGVATSTTFKMDTAANLMVQPWMAVYKHDDATTSAAGTINFDYIRIWQATR